MKPKKESPKSEFFPAGPPVPERVVAGLAKIGLALRSQGWQEAGRRGLTPTQAQILRLLPPPAEQGLRLGEVANALAVTPATASDAVRSLVEKGLVRKSVSGADRRAVELYLSPAGRRELDQIAGLPDFLRAGVEALDAKEVEAFLRSLIKVIRTLQEAGMIPVSRMCVSCRFFHPYAYSDPERPHHCAFVDAPFGDGDLRLDCSDHDPADPDSAAKSWMRFSSKAALEATDP